VGSSCLYVDSVIESRASPEKVAAVRHKLED